MSRFGGHGRVLFTGLVGAALAVGIPVGATSAATPPTLPPGYVTLMDDTGHITLAVPPTWTDIDTAPVSGDTGEQLANIAAAPSIDSFTNTFDTPGVRYVAFTFTPNPQTVIDQFGLTTGCGSLVTQPYNDGVFVGLVQVGTSCGTAGQATWNMVVASPQDASFTAVVQVQTASPADRQALDTVLATFNYSAAFPPTPTIVPGPTIAPIPVPTLAVVPVPTIAPIPVPTLAVVPVPTIAPIPVPTLAVVPVPTIAPVPVPTIAPVPVPTIAPVPGPTIAPGPTLAPAPGPTVAGTTLTLTDDTGLLTVDVPSSWAQAQTVPAANGHAFILASPDLATYLSADPAAALTVPGLSYLASDYTADPMSALTFVGGGLGTGCTAGEAQPYDDNVFVGFVQVFRDCGGTPTLKAIIVASPPSNTMTVTLVVQLQTIDDPALDIILGSFNFIG